MMRQIGGILIIGWILSAWSVAGIESWSTSGPYGGSVRALAIDPRTPNVLYAATGGGVFISRNWGQSWTASNQGLVQTEIDDVVIDPADPSRLYAAGVLHIYKSTDAGQSWTRITQGLTGNSFNRLNINPQDPRIVYVASYHWEGGVFKSTDAGAHWTQVNAGLTALEVSALAMDPLHPETLYAGTFQDGVFRTTDGGGSWTAANNGLANLELLDLAVDPFDCQTVYAATKQGIFISTDGGDNWALSGNGISGQDNYMMDVAADPSSPGTLYASTTITIYKSTDGGARWSTIAHRLYGGSVLWVTVDPRSSNVVYAAPGGTGVFRSLDGGTHWMPVISGLTGIPVNDLVPHPDEPGRVFAACEGDLFVTDDTERRWAPAGPRVVAMSLVIDPTAPQNMYAGYIAGVLLSTDGGQTWADPEIGPPRQAYIRSVAIHPHDPRILYAGLSPYVPVDSVVYKSTDSGLTWWGTGDLGSQDDVMDLLTDPFSPDTVYAALWGSGGIYKSTNGGLDWQVSGDGLSGTLINQLAMDPNSGQVLYSVSTSGGVNKSTNAGASWFPVNEGLGAVSERCLAVDPQDSQRVYLGTFNTGLFESTDGGGSWHATAPLLARSTVSSLLVHPGPPRTVYAGTWGGVYSITARSGPSLDIFSRSGQVGAVDPSLASQLLPASSMILALSHGAFLGLERQGPSIIEIKLPAGALLSQTLADGDLSDLDLHPVGKRVWPLAVSEYAFNGDSAAYEPLPDSSGPVPLGFDAVQLFRYMAGEDRIWLRVTEGLDDWEPTVPESFLGITIGPGSGVWPPDPGSNWGEAGVGRQACTQIFADLRGYDFALHGDRFPVTVRAFRQVSGEPLGAVVVPEVVNLFDREIGLEDLMPSSSQMGGVVTDFAVVDLDGDGREDVVSIDRIQGRLFWVYGNADGAFGGFESRELIGASPVTVDAADVTGDGRPDLLVADSDGQLAVYTWEQLFPQVEKSGRESVGPGDLVLEPDRVVPLTGVISAALAQDLDGDHLTDFIYTDVAAGTLTVLYGQSFNTFDTYPSGQEPTSLACGDVDGDGDPDLAVANRGNNSVSVFRNNGASGLSRSDYETTGDGPAMVQLADFNLDGRADLAVTLAGSKAVEVWPARQVDLFDPSDGQLIYFRNIPSALQAENFDGQHGADLLVGFADYHKLALCTSDAAGIITHAYNLNTLGDMELDPVNHVTLTENSVLSVATGTSYGGVCTQGGVAAVADQPFNLVHFPRSADLSFAVVNLGSQTALLNLELYDDAGVFRQALTQPVAPGQQFARYLTNDALFGAMADSPDRWARGFLTEPETYGFWLANDGSTLNYLDGLPLPDARQARSAFLLPAAPPPGGFVEVLLLNPGQAQAQVTVECVGSGKASGVHQLLLPGRGRATLDPGALFPGFGETDYLRVQADRPIIGCELFGDTQKLAVLDALPLPAAPEKLFCPHVAVGNLGVDYRTEVTLVNPGEAATSVTLSLYSDAGAFQGSAPPVALPARSKAVLDIGSLFGLTQPASGYVTVETTGAGAITGTVTFGETGPGRFLACLPLLGEGTTDFLLGHLANGTLGETTFFTGLAILNPSAADQLIELAAFDQTGLPLSSTMTNVAAGARDVFLIDQKLPGLISIFGGYLHLSNRAENPGPVMVFALFGDQSLNFLSAVTAQPLRME